MPQWPVPPPPTTVSVPAPPPAPAPVEDLGVIIRRLQASFIRTAAAHEVFDALLPDLLRLSGSAYGFIGEVWRDERQKPYLKIFTLSDISWDDATREMVARERRNGIEFRNLDNLLGSALTTAEVVISNDPANDARRGGLPPGHPGLRSFLGVPLLHGGELVGEVGLANREGGYDTQLVERLQPLLASVAAIVSATLSDRQRRRAEEALRLSEARFRAAFEMAAVGMAHVALDGGLREVNQRFCEILGRTRDEVQSLRFSDVTHPDDVAEGLAQRDALLSGRMSDVHTQKRYLRPDGSIVWVNLTVALVRDSAGAPLHFISVIEDISEQKQAESVLRDRDELLHKLTRQVPGLVYQFRLLPGGQRLMPYASNGLRELFELEPDAVRDDASMLFERIHPGDLPAIEASMRHGVASLAPTRSEFRVVLPRRGQRWLAGEAAPEALADGSVLWTGYLMDVTDRRRYEEALVLAEAAERANRAKTEFLSRMSHELRTPLNAVLGFAQLLRVDANQPLSAAQRAKVEHIESAGAHLLAMIADVLDLSRIEAGGLPLSLEALRVAQVIDDALSLMAHDAQHAGVSLDHEAPDVRLHVRGDHVRLRQVLTNLLSNAIKYNRAGGSVRVHAGVEAGRAGGPPLVAISVRDTGSGLSAEQRMRLYEPFNRLGAERSGIEGTGIGLVITRKLVELMGGLIDVDSEPGSGSCFTVRLPLTQPPSAVAALPGMAKDAGDGASCKVLYAEDNEVNVELVRQVMGLRPQWQLVVARNGAEAIELARCERPNLLLLDMHLGDMSGFDVLQALEADPALAAMPRVALSADAMPEQIRAARLHGVSTYLTQPLDVMALLRCLDDHLAGALPGKGGPGVSG
jgi:PAS domain S-box-containing protein